MFIVDSQVRIWREETPDRPWIPGARERMRLDGHREEAFSYAECLALMDEAGVDRAGELLTNARVEVVLGAPHSIRVEPLRSPTST